MAAIDADAVGGAPDVNFAAPWGGAPPTLGAPPAEGYLCWNDWGGTCDEHGRFAVVNCGDFVAWRLPPAPDCAYAYCLEPQ
jgi:hypothetical protein